MWPTLQLCLQMVKNSLGFTLVTGWPARVAPVGAPRGSRGMTCRKKQSGNPAIRCGLCSSLNTAGGAAAGAVGGTGAGAASTASCVFATDLPRARAIILSAAERKTLCGRLSEGSITCDTEKGTVEMNRGRCCVQVSVRKKKGDGGTRPPKRAWGCWTCGSSCGGCCSPKPAAPSLERAAVDACPLGSSLAAGLALGWRC